MTRTNIITIERNVPIPTRPGWGGPAKYGFINNMEVGDSFHINGNTPDFIPLNVKAHMYKLNADSRNTNKFTVRTLEGPSTEPVSIRIWRIR
tara:strand:+ start:122 stop:397 length:276 start_codon:yes stop_codon:yes gene_type:complete